MCGARVYVQRGVYDQVVALSLRQRGKYDDDIDIGPDASQKQVERVSGYIRGRQARGGAAVIVGGARRSRPGHFVVPTGLTHVRPEMQIVQEEIFAPVVAVYRSMAITRNCSKKRMTRPAPEPR